MFISDLIAENLRIKFFRTPCIYLHALLVLAHFLARFLWVLLNSGAIHSFQTLGTLHGSAKILEVLDAIAHVPHVMSACQQ